MDIALVNGFNRQPKRWQMVLFYPKPLKTATPVCKPAPKRRRMSGAFGNSKMLACLMDDTYSTGNAWLPELKGKSDLPDTESAQRKIRNLSRELKQANADLESMRSELEQTSQTLNALIEHQRREMTGCEETIQLNFREQVKPYLEKLRSICPEPRQRMLIEAVEAHLKEILSPLAGSLSSELFNLTPTQIRVAGMVRKGWTSGRIAELMCISVRTVETHRAAIRKKLGIEGVKLNLTTYLMTLK